MSAFIIGDLVTPVSDPSWVARIVELHSNGWIKVEPLQRPIRSLWLFPKAWRFA